MCVCVSVYISSYVGWQLDVVVIKGRCKFLCFKSNWGFLKKKEKRSWNIRSTKEGLLLNTFYDIITFYSKTMSQFHILSKYHKKKKWPINKQWTTMDVWDIKQQTKNKKHGRKEYYKLMLNWIKKLTV